MHPKQTGSIQKLVVVLFFIVPCVVAGPPVLTEVHPIKPAQMATNYDSYFNNKLEKATTKNIYIGNVSRLVQDYVTLKGHDEDVIALNWSSDGKKLVSGSQDNTAILWDAAKASKLHVLKHDQPVKLVAFSKDDKVIITAMCNAGSLSNSKLDANADVADKVHFWDTGTGEKKATIDPQLDGVTAMRVLPKIDIILIAGQDKTLTMWSISKREKLHTWKLKACITMFLAHANGRRVYTVGVDEKVIRCYDLEEKLELTAIAFPKVPIEELTLSSNGSYLISVEKNTDLQFGLDKKKADGAMGRILWDIATLGLSEVYFQSTDVGNRPVHVWSTKSNKLVKSGRFSELRAIIGK